jgi:hypothetical protein
MAQLIEHLLLPHLFILECREWSKVKNIKTSHIGLPQNKEESPA